MVGLICAALIGAARGRGSVVLRRRVFRAMDVTRVGGACADRASSTPSARKVRGVPGPLIPFSISGRAI